LPIAEDALFDSYAEQHNPICLAGTRVDVLQSIHHWIDDQQSKPILWLNGMAGTGKSTISRTIAKARSEGNSLAASFFFKRGERDRGSLIKFVPSLARQLAKRIAGLAQLIASAIDADPDLIGKDVTKQFTELIQGPLFQLNKAESMPSRLVIVIDALDECQGEEEIRSLIDILSRATLSQPSLRIFITSRPDFPIRLGFAQVNNTYRALVLQDVSANSIEHDIYTFMNDRLQSIRVDYNTTLPEELKLPSDWPGVETIKRLTTMAIPLFIFAATACRFIGDYRVDSPSQQLSKFLQLSIGSNGSYLDQTYRPVLQSMIANVPEQNAIQITEQFRHIVGSIVCLVEPLSTRALSELLDVSVSVVDSRLRALHSVLSIPPNLDEPVRILHSSFRDYLTDVTERQSNKFWVDEPHTHAELLKGCLRVMSANLRQDICNLVSPGTSRSEVSRSKVDQHIPPALQYACLSWVAHKTTLNDTNQDNQLIHDFLKHYFPTWLEVMSLLDRTEESLSMLQSMASCLEVRPEEKAIPNYINL
jgi:hypothetical protein